jgi:LmbE family N-acetylglucosaminyl deacetylase
MRARREEDLEALGLLDARAVHLPFSDAQYEVPAAPEQLAAALEQTIERVEPTHLLIPLGLFHSDHLLVSDLCLPLLARAPAFDMLAYEDVPYRRMPGSVQTRLCELARRGLLAQAPCALDSAATPQRERSKHAALVSYRSQFRAFGPGGHADLFSPERYWQLGVDANMAEAPTRGTSLAEPTLPVR